jgi:hypothetical protein
MASQRITKDFVSHFKLLRDRTGNSVHNVRRALDRDPQIAASIEELDRIERLVEMHRKQSKRRFIVQTDAEFPAAFRDYQSRWMAAVGTLRDWEDDRAGRPRTSETILKMLEDMSQSKLPTSDEEWEDWDFNPDNHSAAEHIDSLAENAADKSDDFPFFSRAAQAYKWLCSTVGLDLRALEERWSEFPVFIVPKHVSDEHGLEEQRSLYAYLDNVRLAYMIGADLSAIATCRAITEILLRKHYSADESTGLTQLIRQIQGQTCFQFLKQFNLLAKVEQANGVLHSNRTDIRNNAELKSLIREWVKVLQEMISKAPRPELRLKR